MLTTFITNLIIVAAVTGVLFGIRYLLWKDNVPENISKFRWLIAFGVVIIVIMIEVGVNLEVRGTAQILNAIILISVAQMLKNTKSDTEKKSTQNTLSSNEDRTTKDEYTCSDCNSSVNENDKFCSNCGADISSKKNINYTCSNCNQSVNEKDKFCANCGSALRMDKF